MAKFSGKGSLKKYSKTIKLDRPLLVKDLEIILNLPKEYSENVIAIRENRKLDDNDFIHDEDQIDFFLTVMGG